MEGEARPLRHPTVLYSKFQGTSSSRRCALAGLFFDAAEDSVYWTRLTERRILKKECLKI